MTEQHQNIFDTVILEHPVEILFNANSLLLVIIINILIFTSLTYIKSRLSLHLCTNLNHDIFMQEN